jgi:hypothetical protein
MEQPFQNGNWKRDSEKDNTIGRKFRTTVRFAVSARVSRAFSIQVNVK